MNFIWSGLFWGIILVLLGFSVILKSVLNIDIPIFKIVFALILIYLGIKLLTVSSVKNRGLFFFDSTKTSVDVEKDEYNIIFGSGVIDLREVVELQKKTSREINIIFGAGTIILPENTPVKIKTDTVFGGSRFPDGKTDFFGEYKYRHNSGTEEETLYLEINVIFGSLTVED
jgi:predicted membrane protein